MKTTEKLLLVSLAIAIAGAVIGVVTVKRQGSPETATREAQRKVEPDQARNQTRSVAQTPAISESMSPEDTAADFANPNASPVVKAGIQINSNAPQPASPATPRKPKEEIKDPDARVALRFVGVDPEAEAYWIAAINDPRLSAHERQDLIEDLNEEGFSDPKNPGIEDLPLIVIRLERIWELAPDAMDKVNADAFAEAYKDLANMFIRLTER